MRSEELYGVVEALLFASDVPLTLTKIRSIIPATTAREIEEALDHLAREYESTGRSFQLLRVAKGYQLYTRNEYAAWVAKLYKGRRAARLSRAALETLSVIAYRQPVARSGIEAIRGVESQTVLNTLQERSLIRICGRAAGPGRPLLYETTGEFLRYFGLRDLGDLPAIGEFERVLGVEQGRGGEPMAIVSVESVSDGDEAQQIPLTGGGGGEEEVRPADQGGKGAGERSPGEPPRADGLA